MTQTLRAMTVAMVALAFLVVGACATTTQPQPKAQVGVCLPPGVPQEILTAQTDGISFAMGKVEDGSVVPIMLGLRVAGGHEYGVALTGGRIIMVDPDPHNDAAVPWIDFAMLAPDAKTMAATPSATCNWKKPQRGGTTT